MPSEGPHDTRHVTLRRRIALGLLVLVALWGLVAMSREFQPVPPPQVVATRPAPTVPCISYAPYRRDGHSPFVPGLRIDERLIETDLRQLATITSCVRTYGVDNGLDAVPSIARRLGLRVVLGVWIGRDAGANEDQLTRALKVAREHKDVVHLLVVGNEVLLRRELTPQALAIWLARARRESPVPVAYADVWEFWMAHGAVLRPHVDRVAIHVLPYWEDHPVPNARAAAYVHEIAARMRTHFAPQPVWVAETGWPAEGRQRGPAVPGHAEQSRFIRELLAREGTAQPLRFNLIEGFDQPWKRRLEGAMGGYWGWFDAQGRARVRLEGPLPEPSYAHPITWAAATGVLLMACFWALSAALRPRDRAHRSVDDESPPGAASWWRQITGVFAACVVAAALGASAAMQWQHMVVWNRNAIEWGWSLLMAMVTAAWVLTALTPLTHALSGGTPTKERAARWAGAVAAWRSGAPLAERWASGLLLFLLFGTALSALWLVFDGRYRPLMAPMAWVAALAAGLLSLLGRGLDAQAREERLLAAFCGALALAVIAVEGVFNGQALIAASSWLTLAVIAWSGGTPSLHGWHPRATRAT